MINNLYLLHSNPKELHGFDIVPYKLPEFAYQIAKTNRKLRPKLEPIIMKDPEWAFEYAEYVLIRPWPEAEPYIMKDPEFAYMYTKYVLERHWPEAEPYIMKDPKWEYYYAIFILKRRWLEAEPYIMKHPHIGGNYTRLISNYEHI